MHLLAHLNLIYIQDTAEMYMDPIITSWLLFEILAHILLKVNNLKVNFISLNYTSFFKDPNIKIFDLKCEMISLNVTCTLKYNITNYASSNQSVLIDYGDGSNEIFYIDPHCLIV